MYSEISKASPLVLPVHGSEVHPSSNVQEPKARKPYTITKQREKWTEEEHRKFLEALKLYGRAWRRIEEHIGTKTAVQIRSHAQKFFSKVVREPGNSNSDPGEAIEIPPPRPKRKPMHPYPRKFARSPSVKGGAISNCVARSSSPSASSSEQEKGSPISVLSAAGSDTIESTITSPQNDSTSPDSSLAGSSPTSMLAFEQENGSMSSSEEERGSPLPASGSCQADNSCMELDSGDKEEKVPSVGSPITCLKLFGATVLIIHPQEPSSDVNDIYPQFRKTSSLTLFRDMEQNIEEGQKSELTLQTNLASFFTRAGRQQHWGATPVIPELQISSEDLKPRVGTTSLPQGAQYGSMSPVVPPLCVRSTGASNLCVDVSDDPGLSFSAPNSSYGGNVLALEKMADVLDSSSGETPVNRKEVSVSRLKVSENSAFTKPKKLGSSQRGFVPYKRCMAERDEQQPLSGEEINRQRIKLCL